MPTITFNLTEDITDYFEDILLELNKEKKDNKYVDIQSRMREILRDYIALAWRNYVQWKTTNRIGDVEITLNLIYPDGYETTEEKQTEGTKRFTLLVGKLMLSRLKELLPWENSLRRKSRARDAVMFRSIADHVKTLVVSGLSETIKTIEEQALIDEEKMMLAEEEKMKNETTS